MADAVRARLAELRGDLHRHPEPGWCEFRTTARLVEELHAVGVDELVVGADACDPIDRTTVPSDDRLDEWYERALDRETDPELLEPLRGGTTDCIVVLDRGEGPTIGLRVDIDGLFIEESDDADHSPAAEGFRPRTGGMMYTCDHGTYVTWGLATLEVVKKSGFSGRLVMFFQPAEGISGGGMPIVKSEYIAGIDYFFVVHVGLDHPTDEVVAGIEEPLAIYHIDAGIEGTTVHAGKAPEAGMNTVHVSGTTVESVYGIPRHSDGTTRVNIGRAEGGTASNVIAGEVEVVVEARGETTEFMEYVKSKLRRRFEKATGLRSCEATVDVVSESPRAGGDPELMEAVADAVETAESVNCIVQTAGFGTSEDATFLMERVRHGGDLACYFAVGTDHPTSHHTATFDVDEQSLETSINVLMRSILSVAGLESAPTIGVRANR